MKVCMVTALYPSKTFGGGTFVRDLFERMKSNNVDMRLCYGKLWIDLSKKIRKVSKDCDLVHTHFAYPEGFLSSILVKNKPKIITTHRIDVIDHPKKWHLRQAVKYSLNDADKIIAVSEAIRKQASKYCKDKSKIEVVYNSVDVDRFNPKKRSNRLRKRYKDKFIVFGMGQLIKRKGFQFLVEIADRSSKEHKDVVFLIGGDGPYKDKLRKMIDELSLDNIKILGFVPHEDVPSLFASADLFVSPSLSEGHAVVILEAMASGLPIISTDVGGARETITKESGLLIPENNTKKLYDSINKLLSDRKKAKIMGHRARDICVENFSWEKNINKIIKIYNEVLK